MFFSMYLKIIFSVCAIFSCINAFKHVVMIHGLFGDRAEFFRIVQWLDKDHPGTNYTILNEFTYLKSLDPLWMQLDVMKLKVKEVMLENPEGVHIIGYSQGGLLSRGLIESIPDHNIKNFISLSSPQAGQYGQTSFLKYFPYLAKKEAYLFFYTKEGQKFSVGNYWNDPHHNDLYLLKNVFLPELNNEVKTNNSHLYKKGMLSLDNLVLIGGPDDGVIEPWQSSHFGFYDKNETVQLLENQPYFIHDSFGLKTLYETKRLHLVTVPKIEHLFWPMNYTVWEKHILPWLT